jgi:hypothetical protein
VDREIEKRVEKRAPKKRPSEERQEPKRKLNEENKKRGPDQSDGTKLDEKSARS